MERLIPPSTKTRTILVFGLNWIDILVGSVCLIFTSLFIISGLDSTPKMIGVLSTIGLVFILLMKAGNLRGYQFFFYFLTFGIRKKRMENISLKEECGVTFKNNMVVTPNAKSKIIEIHGIDFGILPERKQDTIIHRLSQLYKNVKKGKIVKIDKPVDFSSYLNIAKKKLKEWEEKANNALDSYGNEEMPDAEAFGYASRIEILQNTIQTLEYNHNINKQYLSTFYLILFDVSEDSLNYTIKQSCDLLNNCLVDSHILDENEVKSFYENYFETSLDENDDFYLPTITEQYRKILINGEKYRIATIDRLPLYCANGWLSEVFNVKGAKVVMDFNVEANKQRIYKTINKTIVNLQSMYIDKSTREDEKVDLTKKLTGIQELLDLLKMDNEMLHSVSVYILYHDEDYKEVEEKLHNVNLYTDGLYFRQFNSYLAMMPYDHSLVEVPGAKYQWQTTTLSATFPFVTKAFMDEGGNYLGSSDSHVFFDQFYSWKHIGEKRTSPNMVVMGKTGGGKSYYMKKLIMQHLCDDVKCFILDPENEYDYLAQVFGGNVIDVGGIGNGIINPLQVFPTLRPDEAEEINSNSVAIGEVSSHRQFLQEFFNIIMPKVDDRCFVFLDEALGELYSKYNITDVTDIQSLKPQDFPSLEDLYDVIDKWTEAELNNPKALEYNKVSLVILRNNMKSFKTGGVYSKLWNGVTSLELTNDFTVLNFQSLFSANNSVVANAQMLLVMRYLNQEVIKNKNNNELYGLDKNMIVAVDEAHQFINPRFPVALDFMAQMVKRIRKYGGGMIITTQNIADFIGQSEETKAKATAVIDGCQYTMVFGLNPNDVNNIIDLYKKYNGGLTQNEIDLLTDAQQGEALFLVDSSTRMSIKINLLDGEEDYIIRPKNINDYINE